MSCRKFRYGALLLALALPAALAADARPRLAGLSLEAAIGVLRQDGLKIFYSSDLVHSGMRITTEPAPDDPAEALTEVLAPLGLTLRRGLNGAWLVVRNPNSPRKFATSPELPAIRSESPAAIDLPKPIEEIVVAASRYEIRRAGSGSEHLISNRDLENLPDIGDDTLRAVARLPGTASNGISALANIRGGEINETLVRLDGLRLYEPFHLKDFQGVFSAIDPRIVSTMDVYTGAFPASFGDRMSGVIDVETIGPPDDLYHEIGISFFNSSILSTGQFADQRAHWIASVRRSNLDLLYEQFSRQPERPRYTDAFAKLSFDLGDHTTITGSLLRADDDIALADDVDREERANASQVDTYTWLKLDHRLGGRTSGSTILARSRIDSSRTGTSEKLGVSAGSLSDRRSFSIDSLQSDWSRLVGERALFDFGAAIAILKGRYDYQDTVSFDLLFDFDGAPAETTRSRSVAISPRGHRYELFTTMRFDFNPRVATEVGLRWDQQSIDNIRHSSLGPRLGLSWSVTTRTTLRANWARIFQAQAINELQVNDGISSYLEPQASRHLVFGLDHSLGTGTLLRIEAYDKELSQLKPRFENLLNTRVLLPELKPDRVRIAPSGGHGRGLEISLDGQSGPFRWWSGLSWARVDDRIDGGDIPRSWDQTYTLQAGTSYDGPKWDLGAGFVYRSGWPSTIVALRAGEATPTVDVATRNAHRMNAYGSLDIRLSREFQLDQSALTLSLELANLTDRNNPCCIEYEIGDELDAGQLVLDEINYLPRIPSIGLLWKF